MVNFRRNKIPGDTYFFTVTLHDRKARWLIDHIETLRTAFNNLKIKYPFKTLAFVILPDHLHTIWELPDGQYDFSTRWKSIKCLFTKGLIAKGIKLIRDDRGEYRLWQRRFWEHTIRDNEDLERHVNYIHYNPLKHGLVKRVADWPYSSFHHYVEKGILPLNWSSSSDSEYDLGFGE